ncbi:MAG: uracil-DNA glycosylase family protein [Bacteroidota bacterium]
MLYPFLEQELFDVPSTDELCNPYEIYDEALDVPGAPLLRRENMRSYLEHFEATPPEVLLVAEAPGPWGCRFSGVPLTSEAQLVDPAFPVDGRQTSRRDAPIKEYSANIVWGLLQEWFPRFMLWNCVPFHPTKSGQPLTIRTPRVSEVKRFGPFLEESIRLARPGRVVAVGRKAEASLQRLAIDHIYVRHPSQGGATLFREGIREVLEL